MQYFQNEGKIDRIIRAIIGVILLVVFYNLAEGWLRTLVLVLAIISLVTALTGFCALYRLFNFSTKK